MSISPAKLKELINACNLEDIFMEHLGWDECEHSISIMVKFAEEEFIFNISAIAQKRGFVICRVDCDTMPTKAIRQKLARQFERFHHEHLLILRDSNNNQTWMVMITRENKPRRHIEVEYYARQNADFLIEKLSGLVFSLQEEGALTITDVVGRATATFTQNAEKVTRKFYEGFRKELKGFQEFIKGLGAQVDKEQYAALMLNRLMFIYFIQRKGFLDNDTNYLENRLTTVQAELGEDKFYTGFYRHFLMTLFHKGLGAPEESRDVKVKNLIGKVPYLNGGLFDEHKIEKEYGENINIPDKAFEKLFAFFNEYHWHLDNRPTASGKDINPDVIGYIFEKYINDRASMGAYYTGEDITGYIARNTILPHLLRQTKIKCKEAFNANDGTIWKLLRDNPNDYIYKSVQHGCDKSDEQLPPEIKQGINTDAPNLLQRREKWNTAADSEWALPTETWREVIARRQRYFALRQKIQNGDIADIADLITYNLDIEKLTQDTIMEHEGSDFISAFYFAIAGRETEEGKNIKEKQGITILDPACGSGAFLFAALNVLEPLYEFCIARMREFVAENDTFRAKNSTIKLKYDSYRKILKKLDTHQNERYWIYKNIILHNLFGVDIMPEAAEVAKLRLFLKLAAEATPDKNKPNMGLEPLPDIDFNIRAGNTLVGFASLDEFKKIAGKSLLDKDAMTKVYDSAEKVGYTYNRFIDSQTISNIDTSEFKNEKMGLQKSLEELNKDLDNYWASVYRENTKPFHWFSEFYNIIENGGFDIVIGNPPYVQYNAALKKQYTVKEYRTESCGDLYAFFVERAKSLISDSSPMGMIIPVSAFSTDKMSPLMNELLTNKTQLYISTYDTSPSKLFNVSKADQRLAIYLFCHEKPTVQTTNYMRWNSVYRPYLMDTLRYEHSILDKEVPTIPKIKNDIALNIMKKILSNKKMHVFLSRPTDKSCICYYHNTPRYWTRATDYIPYFWRKKDDRKISPQIKKLHANEAISLCALINSSLFYFWYIAKSDCRHLNNREIKHFPLNIDSFHKKYKKQTTLLVKQLMDNYRQHVERKENHKATIKHVIFDEFHPKHGKSIINKIDKILAQHYGFTEEELDYIINYDYKYRMSKTKE